MVWLFRSYGRHVSEVSAYEWVQLALSFSSLCCTTHHLSIIFTTIPWVLRSLYEYFMFQSVYNFFLFHFFFNNQTSPQTIFVSLWAISIFVFFFVSTAFSFTSRKWVILLYIRSRVVCLSFGVNTRKKCKHVRGMLINWWKISSNHNG